ncbi:IniB N-terminal domain-containing protein [Actinoplanes sp. NPDC051411]|uniref:IniB N-terminal domain-containing protein n=1 Tax=Actinoplanes sp. NPDC051411 TaxID=3155522 RepID=UPI003445F5EE
MDTSPTLQDFVLNLIYDPAARSAFELDPESALHAAGLGDVTAADVQQVIPLVVDSAPVAGLQGLAGVDDLTTGVANLDVAGAVSQLQSITSQVALTPAGVVGEVNNTLGSVNAAVIGVTGDNILSGSVLSGNTLGVAGLGGLASSIPVGLGGVSAGNDPALHLDNTVVPTAEHTVTDTVGSVAPGVDHIVPGVDTGVTGLLDGPLDTVTNLPGSLPIDHTPSLDVPGVGAATSSIGSIVKPDLGHVLSHDPVNDLHNTVSSVASTGHDVTSGLLGGVTHTDTTDSATGQDASHDLLGGLHL